LSENLPQFDFGEFPHHPLEMNTPMILSDPTSKNPADLNQVSMEARDCSISTSPPTRKLLIQVLMGNEIEMCGSAIMCNVTATR
jgi:hypothetical protein